MLSSSQLFDVKQDSVLFDFSPEVIVLIDVRGNIININKQVYRWLKIKPEAFIGKNIFELAMFTPASRALIKKNFTQRLQQVEIEPYEIECLDRDGNTVVGRVTGKLIKTKGQVTSILVMISNVTQLELEMKNRLLRSLQSEARYQSLFENMSSAVVICDFDPEQNFYLIKKVNRVFLQREKTTKKKVLGRRLREIFPGLSWEELSLVLKKAWDLEIPQPFLFEIQTPDGIRYKKGTIYRLETNELTIIYDDVTKSVLDEQNILKSEAKFRHVFETANDGIFILRGKKFIDCNQRTLSLLGCSSRSQIINHTPIDFSPTKQPSGQSSSLLAMQYIVAAANKPQRFPWQHQRVDGELIDVEVSLNNFILDDEPAILAIVRDMTEEMAIRRQLVLSEKRFRTVVENGQAIVFILDQEGKFILSEGKKLSTLGLKPGEVVGRSALVMYKDYPQIVAGINSALKGTFARETVAVGGIYFDIFYSPYLDEKTGKNLGVIGMAVDVTESERFKEKLMELDQAKTEFISIASHQLRSPLVNMRWGLELMLESSAVNQNPEIRRQTAEVHKSCLKMAHLVNDLLDISRIDNDRVANRPRDLDVMKQISDLLESEKQRLVEKNLHVQVNGPTEAHVRLDETRFKAVLSNLLSNAIKFNKNKGVIAIFVKNQAEGCEISLANTGYPILKTEHSRMFERFFRGSNVSSEVEGTGLGLSIAKSYVDLWGGKITFASPVRFSTRSLSGDDYSGTVFRVWLPKK